jgi:hypothetical protein
LVTVYRLLFDYKFQTINSVEEGGFVKRIPLPAVGRSYAETWTSLPMYVLEPTRRKGDFYGVTADVFGCSAELPPAVRRIMERDGELLPITIEDRPGDHFVWNVTRSLDALDENATKWEWYGATRGSPIAPVFRRELLERPCVFKVPPLTTYVFVASGIEPAEEDFYVQYKKARLKGLEFKPVWSG